MTAIEKHYSKGIRYPPVNEYDSPELKAVKLRRAELEKIKEPMPTPEFWTPELMKQAAE